MIKPTTNSQSEQARRLRTKTQEQLLARLAVDGAGISPWEADVLVQIAKDVFFGGPEKQPLRSGQMFYDCVADTEGAGKPLRECRMVQVLLTIHEPEDIERGYKLGAEGLKCHLLMRYTQEAYDQGGLLSQEDLGVLLHCDTRTVRRYVQTLKARNTYPITRGHKKDIGPGISHRRDALRFWTDGMEPVEVARRINHSLEAVERYIQAFARVVFLYQKKFDCFSTALAMGVSVPLVKSYLNVFGELKTKPGFRQRLEEIAIVGGKFYEAQDFEKGGATHSANAKNGWRKR